MKICYGYNRTPRDFASYECDRVFIDDSTTHRQERTDMMQCLGNAAKADTLFLLQRGDLGAGREITALMAEIEALNVTVQVSVVAPQREGRGRPRTFDPTREQAIKLKRLWHSTLPLHHVLQRASEITGADVKRHQMIYRFGSRWRK